MMELLIALSLLLPPLAALVIAAWPSARAASTRVAPWTSVPAVALVLLGAPGDSLDIPWVLLGLRLGMDETGQVFLLFTAALWALSGWYAGAYLAEDRNRHRFFVFFLLAMTGNFGLVLAQDIVGFYTFFALMTFASYGLVVHDGTPFVLRAGTIYIVLAVMGEFLILLGVFLAARAAGDISLADVPAAVAVSPDKHLIVGLLLAGFGVKVGLVGLHVWLPLAHPAAPTPASAVLSGAMIKAGLLGWLRFLPLGEDALVTWGALLMALGMMGALYGVLIGLTQANAKSALAYSSVSQMGIITTAVGIGLAVPEAWPLALTAVLVYALHHGLAKGALFLGVGVAMARFARPWQRWLVLAALALPALSIAGAPLTSGAVAKITLKYPAELAPFGWPGWLDLLLPLSAIGTTLLMSRFLYLAWRLLAAENEDGHEAGPGLWVPWGVLVVAAAVALWLVPFVWVVYVAGEPVLPPGPLWEAGWPVAVGAALAWTAWLLSARLPVAFGAVPMGDLATPLDVGVRRAVGWVTRMYTAAPIKLYTRLARQRYIEVWTAFQTTLPGAESRLADWRILGVMLLGVVLGLALLLGEVPA